MTTEVLELNPAPNFLDNFNVADFPYLEPDFELPTTGESGWYETPDYRHKLPWQIIGDLETAKYIIMVHHGGPGDNIQASHIAPLLDIEGVAIFAYNQRLSGSGDKLSQYIGPDDEDPLLTHTPELLVGDVEDIRRTILKGKVVSHFGGSFATALSMLHAEEYPETVENIEMWGITNARIEELENLYAPDGRLATDRPLEYKRFSENAIPEADREAVQGNSLALIKYYNEKMNLFLEGYDPKVAEDLAIAFGLLHLSAADPEQFSGLSELPTPVLVDIAKGMNIRPDLYARVAMQYFAEYITRVGEDEGDIIRNVGKLLVKQIYMVSGGEDPLTLAINSEMLEKAIHDHAPLVVVHREVIESGHHDRSHAPVQIALRAGALALFGQKVA